MPLHTFTVPISEKHRNISAAIKRDAPCNLSHNHRIAGCSKNAIITAVYPII